MPMYGHGAMGNQEAALLFALWAMSDIFIRGWCY